MSRSKILITLGLILLMTLPAAVAQAETVAEDVVGSGTAMVKDSFGMSDMLVYSMSGVTALQSGEAYEGWLINSETGEAVSTGTMAQVNGMIDHEWSTPDASNILATYDMIKVTIEPVPDEDAAPSDNLAFSAVIPSDAIDPVRQLIVAGGEADTGLLTQLEEQIHMAIAKVDEAQAASEISELQAATAEAVGIIDSGIMPLVASASEQANLAIAGEAGELASKVIGASDNMSAWAEEAKAGAEVASAATDIEVARTLLNVVNGRLAAAADGVDADTADGLSDAYVSAQMMATFNLKHFDVTAIGAPSDVGDGSVPAAMQLAMLAALMLLIGGSTLLYRERRQAAKA